MSVGYRLRVIRLVPIASAAGSYGSGNYGDQTYGPRATDTADLQHYEVVPTTVSPTDYPLLGRRTLDSGGKFECWLIAFTSIYEGVERSGVKLDLSGVASAVIQLVRVSSGPPLMLDYPMEIVLPDRLRRTFAGQLTEQGTYRAAIKLTFNTGREYTVPLDDSMTFVFTPSHETGVIP